MSRCPYAQRSWMTLLEKGIDFEFKTVDLQARVVTDFCACGTLWLGSSCQLLHVNLSPFLHAHSMVAQVVASLLLSKSHSAVVDRQAKHSCKSVHPCHAIVTAGPASLLCCRTSRQSSCSYTRACIQCLTQLPRWVRGMMGLKAAHPLHCRACHLLLCSCCKHCPDRSSSEPVHSPDWF